jgi:hypothetical protein
MKCTEFGCPRIDPIFPFYSFWFFVLKVAIKMLYTMELEPETVVRFVREASLLASLHREYFYLFLNFTRYEA